MSFGDLRKQLWQASLGGTMYRALYWGTEIARYNDGAGELDDRWLHGKLG